MNNRSPLSFGRTFSSDGQKTVCRGGAQEKRVSLVIGGKEKFRSWLPHGFDFLPPEDTRRLRNMETRVRSIFESAGYQEVVPPTLDFAPTFGLSAGDADAEPFETRDSDGE